MVTQRKLIAAILLHCVVYCATAHLAAKGAGIFLLTDIKDNFLYISLDADILNADFIAHLLNAVKVHSLESHLNGEGNKLKGLWIINLQMSDKDVLYQLNH